jgi:hypothetical protein
MCFGLANVSFTIGLNASYKANFSMRLRRPKATSAHFNMESSGS